MTRNRTEEDCMGRVEKIKEKEGGKNMGGEEEEEKNRRKRRV